MKKFGAVGVAVLIVMLALGMSFSTSPARADDATPTATITPSPTLTPIYTEVYVTTVATLRFRASPGFEAPILGTIPAQTTLRGLERTYSNSWVQVLYGEQRGWISTLYATWTGDLFTLPVWGLSVPSNGAPPVGTSPPPGPGELYVENVNGGWVRVRSGPGYNYSTIGTMPPGYRTVANARWGTGNDAFLRVKFNGQEGWVARWIVYVHGSYSTLPDLEPPD